MKTPNTQTLNVLYVEDSQDDIDLMMIMLNKSNLEYNITPCQDLEHLKKLTAEDKYDLIISDYNLHQFSGLEVTKQIRSHDNLTPILIISGAVGEEKAVELIKSGASDFLLKNQLMEIPKTILKLVNEANVKRNSELNKKNFEYQSKILTTLIDSIADFICLKDIDRRYLMVNRAMSEYYEPEFDFKKRLIDLIRPIGI